MARRLFGTKSLSEPMRTYCQADPLEQTQTKYQSKYKTFPFNKTNLKMSSAKYRPFCSGFDLLKGVIEGNNYAVLSVQYGALCDLKQVHCGICGIGLVD